MTGPVRVGDTVRRRPVARAEFVHRLLQWFEAAGWSGAPRELVPTILWQQDRCWRGISAGAKAGEPAMLRLREAGAVGHVQADYRWTQHHRLALARSRPSRRAK